MKSKIVRLSVPSTSRAGATMEERIYIKTLNGYIPVIIPTEQRIDRGWFLNNSDMGSEEVIGEIDLPDHIYQSIKI